MGEIDARNFPVPANVEALFPVWNDVSTWNLAPLSRITTRVFHGLSDDGYEHDVTRHVIATWMQDDWKVGNSLTLNLGVRYDIDSNGHSEKQKFLPWLPGDLPRDRWQATATYTIASFKDAAPTPDQWYLGDNGVAARRPVGFPLAADMGGDYGYAGSYLAGGFGQSGDQRHRAVVNGLWEIGAGVQLSGIYFFGSGERFGTTTGVDRRNQGIGGAAPQLRLRADGTILPRNGIRGSAIHRVDMRAQKRLRIAGRLTIDGIFEVFNLFNHENYGSYVVNESSTEYGKPSFNGNVAYQPRMVQLGFRLTY
jgi:hypothetical protein